MPRTAYKRKIRKSTKQIYTIIAIVLLLLAAFSLYSIFIGNKTLNYSQRVNTYQQTFDQKYNINLFENEYIKPKERPMNEIYMTELIDNMQATFAYHFITTKEANIKYTYSMKGILQGTYDAEEVPQKILEQEYDLVKEKSGQITTKDTEIIEDVTIKLSDYNSIVKSFQDKFGIVIDAKLLLIFHITIEAKVDGTTIKEEYTNDMSVTLGKKVTLVTGTLEDEKIGYTEESIQKIEETNVIIVIIDILLILVGLAMLRYAYARTTVQKRIKNEYKLELNKILRTCQDKIVSVSTQMEIKRGDIIEVRDFGELIKLSEELARPVLCWINKTEDEAWFGVISGNVTYQYILK